MARICDGGLVEFEPEVTDDFCPSLGFGVAAYAAQHAQFSNRIVNTQQILLRLSRAITKVPLVSQSLWKPDRGVRY